MKESTIGRRVAFPLLGGVVAIALVLTALVPYLAHGTGTGPDLFFPLDIAVEASGDLVVIDAVLGAVLRVDPVTGNRTIVSDAGTGAGPSFGFAVAVAVEASGDLLVADFGFHAVLRIDPVTGDRTIVSDAGPNLGFPHDVAVEASGDLVILDFDLDAIVRVDPVTGDRVLLSVPNSKPTNTPAPAPPVGGIAFDPDLSALPLGKGATSGSDVRLIAAAVASVATGAVALGGGAWYMRRRLGS